MKDCLLVYWKNLRGNPLMSKDYLWLNLRELPYFRALLRAVEARFYQEFDLPRPVLDVGCGDGHFAATTFRTPLDVGVDPWTGPVKEAADLDGHLFVIQGTGDDLPFNDGHFGSVISNSVLEHIPVLDPVLADISRVIRPGGLFLFCVPNHNFLQNLSFSNYCDRIGFRKLAEIYRSFFNRISRHYHCEDPEYWNKHLEWAGFKIERWWHYFSPRAFHVLEWGHYFGIPSVLVHWLFGRWIAVPTRWNLALTQAIVQPYYDEDPYDQPQGAYTFYVARKIA
jgi:SAM-dependent methyltransferase